jgi:uncharacterized protein (TIGR00369 family)
LIGMDEAQLEAGGWRRLPVVRYSAAIGVSWMKVIDGKPLVGLMAEEHLGNDNLGIVHGGAIMTFADMALGCATGFATGGTAMFVTAQMQVYFTAAAKVGEFITCQPEVVRKTSSLVFVRGLIESGGRTVASADGMFKLLDEAQMAGMKAG